VTSRDGSDPEVTSLDRKSPGSGHRKPKAQVLGTFELLRAVTRRKWQSHDRKWRHVTSRDWKCRGSYAEVMTFDQKSPGSGRRRPVCQVLGTFEPLHCCNSHEVAVTWQGLTSRDLTSPEVTRKSRHLTGSHLEVAVGPISQVLDTFEVL